LRAKEIEKMNNFLEEAASQGSENTATSFEREYS